MPDHARGKVAPRVKVHDQTTKRQETKYVMTANLEVDPQCKQEGIKGERPLLKQKVNTHRAHG